jgi:hypothetical protein
MGDRVTAEADGSLTIREYDAAIDRSAVRACFVELQEVERALVPGMPPGDDIADAYLELMFRRGREFSGVVLVAEVEREVVGFISIWTRYRSSEPDDDPTEYGFVSDLVVAETVRAQPSHVSISIRACILTPHLNEEEYQDGKQGIKATANHFEAAARSAGSRCRV